MSVVIPRGCVTIRWMGEEGVVTQRALACELLNQLGLEELADHFAQHKLCGPPCPWLEYRELVQLDRVLAAVPEPGGPAVTFAMPIGAAPNTEARIGPDANGMVQLARPPDIEGAAGSISHWMAVLSAPLIMDLQDASRARGGRSSPLDLRTILQQVGWAIERTAKKRGANPPKVARCIALLILVDNRQSAFYQALEVNPAAHPFFDHMKPDAHREAWEKWAKARKDARAEVAPVSRGVFREATVRLINDKVRPLIRDRRGPS